ncbi:hypothetical protein SAMN04488074_12928 [Lentzea albidocapillata subsp. violacea]|uniref:Lipoprotein n=1 Tax=Lentzea albidocapillata subsp. violacea TaxID=128104 RepID=A0A1G9X3I6_9PSEU|nr:hypothetical protein [Lentzea albidocapillata]SDM91267.1 hypothetical protein SAMN04488074_12928 [Lentzea albidocapillata subsp. violacea]
MLTRTLTACVIAVTAALSACKPVQTAPTESAEPWVVLSVTYSGPRGENQPGGKGQHAVVCVAASDLARHDSERGEHIEILIPAEHAYDYDQGTPCPKGPIHSRF